MTENKPFGIALDPDSLVAYQDGSVVSRTLVDGQAGSVTVFAFDEGQRLSEHTVPFDALVQILDGEAEVTIDHKDHVVKTGQWIVMPADVPHALRAEKSFKMSLVMIRK